MADPRTAKSFAQAAALARELVFTPAQAAERAVNYYRRLKEKPGIGIGIAPVDRELLPLRGGDVAGVIGRPGHGKSSVLALAAKHNARCIVAEGLADRECVIYISLEQLVEEMEALFQAGPGHTATDFIGGRLPIEAVESKSLERVTFPIWTIGRSSNSASRGHRMTVESLFLALQGLEHEFGFKPRLICLDYIQIVPVENFRERQHQVTEAIIGSKELAQSIDCPLLFGVQASRAVDGRDDKLPGINDCQWSSQLEQTADKLFALGRPWLWPSVRRQGLPDASGIRIQVTERMLLMRKIKERFNTAGQTYLLDMAPELVEITEREGSLPGSLAPVIL